VDRDGAEENSLKIKMYKMQREKSVQRSQICYLLIYVGQTTNIPVGPEDDTGWHN
jgi:hypothetical protein